MGGTLAADRLVPWCLGGSLLTWILTGNTARAVSVLMVDFSCALKLSMPLALLYYGAQDLPPIELVRLLTVPQPARPGCSLRANK